MTSMAPIASFGLPSLEANRKLRDKAGGRTFGLTENGQLLPPGLRVTL
jgi:hypothetical protein